MSTPRKFKLPFSAFRFERGHACVERWVHDPSNWEYGYMSPKVEWYTYENYLLLNYVVVADTPVYRLPEDVPCTPKVRAEVNTWALEQFGYEQAIPDGEVRLVGTDQRGYVNPRTFQSLMAQCRNLERARRG